MLDRLRNRVNRLFLDDEPEEVEEESTQKQTFQTKMMYQYPTKSAFRFPVIPDEEEVKRDSLDVPAYQRRQRERRQDSLKDDDNDKHIEKEKQRFVPTDVPSPIYGYQKKKRSKEIEDVPAFMRKRRKNNVEKMEQEKLAQDDHKEDLNIDREDLHPERPMPE